jgi:hypothetical protein
MTLQAELLDDAGAAAASPEAFRSPSFMAAEGVTHTMRIAEPGAPDAEALRVPLVVREIEGTGLRDASSSYGYPGGSGPPALDPIDYSDTGLVSVFLRDRVGAHPCLPGGTVRAMVQIADPSLPRKSRMSDRQQVRRNARAGWSVEIRAGTAVSDEQRAGFERAYRETMVRTEAAPRYFFGSEYFAAVIGAPLTWLALALAPGGEVGAGSIAVQSDGYLHYYLSGTADEHLDDSPMKSIVEALIGLAEELGLPLNLGGGARPGDSLEAFKKGFANREEPFHTHEIICDPAAYAELSADANREAGFFPAYRASR